MKRSLNDCFSSQSGCHVCPFTFQVPSQWVVSEMYREKLLLPQTLRINTFKCVLSFLKDVLSLTQFDLYSLWSHLTKSWRPPSRGKALYEVEANLSCLMKKDSKAKAVHSHPWYPYKLPDTPTEFAQWGCIVHAILILHVTSLWFSCKTPQPR